MRARCNHEHVPLQLAGIGLLLYLHPQRGCTADDLAGKRRGIGDAVGGAEDGAEHVVCSQAGHEARIKFVAPVGAAKQVSGIVEGIDGETIRVTTPKGEREVDFANIASAKLLLTDKLIHATAPLSTDGADTIKTEG